MSGISYAFLAIVGADINPDALHPVSSKQLFAQLAERPPDPIRGAEFHVLGAATIKFSNEFGYSTKAILPRGCWHRPNVPGSLEFRDGF